MSDTRLVIIDGYNVIHRLPDLRPGPDRTLKQSRDKLVNLLSWTVGAGDARFLVVFDGDQGGGRSEGSGGRVEVRFSQSPDKADDVIRRIVEVEVDHERRVTVVTGDLEVARHARAMGADVSIADLFMASVLGPDRTGVESVEEKPPTTLSKREIEEWAALFRQRQGHGIEFPEDDPKPDA